MSNDRKFLRGFKMFGNSLMLHWDKSKASMLNGMPESELKLVGDILLPDRTRIAKDLKEEKTLKSIG